MSFLTTGVHMPTLTTVEDPALRIIERDNGLTWTLEVYVFKTYVESYNMERPYDIKLAPGVAELPVYCIHDGSLQGTVGERIAHTLENDRAIRAAEAAHVMTQEEYEATTPEYWRDRY